MERRKQGTDLSLKLVAVPLPPDIQLEAPVVSEHAASSQETPVLEASNQVVAEALALAEAPAGEAVPEAEAQATVVDAPTVEIPNTAIRQEPATEPAMPEPLMIELVSDPPKPEGEPGPSIESQAA